jgi:hypothetical protein
MQPKREKPFHASLSTSKVLFFCMKEIEEQTVRQTIRQAGRQAGRQINKQTDKTGK